MQWFRRPILSIAGRPTVERFTRSNRFIKSRLVDRFVAGESLDETLPKVLDIYRQGMTVTLDELGENVHSEAEARAAVGTYQESLRRLADHGLEPNISIKLTMLGLDLGEKIARDNLTAILETARSVSGFVRIDMEGSAYVEQTMALFKVIHDAFPEHVGIVVQAYLYRARADIEEMIERNARVRLVKGAYAEPSSVAFPDSADIDDNYLRLMYLLLEKGNYPAIATHDLKLVGAARRFAEDHGIPADRFEFQMLYGVRRDAQIQLVADGYRMRVYVPFGTEWYPYFTRRVAERPANALFVLRQFVDRRG
jgi:proline dehydrogenase